jgi:hypothetical protein
MTADADLSALRSRIQALEIELARVKSQRNKAWRDRAEIHASLRAITADAHRSISARPPR